MLTERLGPCKPPASHENASPVKLEEGSWGSNFQRLAPRFGCNFMKSITTVAGTALDLQPVVRSSDCHKTHKVLWCVAQLEVPAMAKGT